MGTRKTVAELNTDFTVLSNQFAEYLKIAPTKEDLNKLATKDDLKDVVKKDDLATFKEEITRQLNDDMNARLETFKVEQQSTTSGISNRVTALEKKLQEKLQEADAKALMQDMHSRRTNYLLLGAPEIESGWKETNKDCLAIVNSYLDKIIPNASSIHIIDCHRLGKKANDVSTLQGKPKCRPIIFKVSDLFEIRMIRDNLKNLDTYFKNNPSEGRVYFRRHLPQKMHLQRKLLQPKFTELYKAGNEPSWQLDIATAKFYIVDKHGNEIRD